MDGADGMVADETNIVKLEKTVYLTQKEKCDTVSAESEDDKIGIAPADIGSDSNLQSVAESPSENLNITMRKKDLVLIVPNADAPILIPREPNNDTQVESAGDSQLSPSLMPDSLPPGLHNELDSGLSESQSISLTTETDGGGRKFDFVDGTSRSLKRRGRAFIQGLVDNWANQATASLFNDAEDTPSAQREQQINADRKAWRLLLQNWANKAAPTRRRLRNLCWGGIPSSCRGKAWAAIIGNDLKITGDLYSILMDRAKSPSSEACSKEESIHLIEVDVPRTFPELQFFHGDGPLRVPLINILRTYVSFRPDVGYIQGMSYIAAMLLLNLNDELSAFIALANLLNRELYFSLFRDFHAGWPILRVFDKLLAKHVPRCSDKFRELQLTSDMYLYDWILTIFSRSFPIDIACRIWDCFLVEGQVFLFRAALGVLKMFEMPFLGSNFEQCLHFFNKIPKNLDERALFHSISTISINERTLQSLLLEESGMGYP